jgi:hypothetical protein
MEVMRFSETSIHVRTTRHYISEGGNIQLWETWELGFRPVTTFSLTEQISERTDNVTNVGGGGSEPNSGTAPQCFTA